MLQITDLVRDSPLQALGVILSQCAHVVVPADEDSFEYDPEEELDIEEEDDVDLPIDTQVKVRACTCMSG